MKLLARIISHGFAIAVVLLLALGLIYRGELFPEYNLPGFLDIGKLADHQEEATTGQGGQSATETETSTSGPSTGSGRDQSRDQSAGPGGMQQEPAGVEAPQPAPGIEPEAAPEMTEATAESPEEDSDAGSAVPVPVEGEQPRGAESPETSAAPMEEPGSPATADVTPPDAMPEDISASMDAAATLPASGEVEPPQETGSAAPASRPQEKAYQLLAAAREAYWLRDYDVAETKYIDLTRVDPDNPDGYGELGNMYFSQGQWDQAASAYYEAGVRLIGQGLLDQAEELVAVIRGLSSGHADDLEQKISEARSTAD